MAAKIKVVAEKDLRVFERKVNDVSKKLAESKHSVIARGASVKGDKFVAFLWYIGEKE